RGEKRKKNIRELLFSRMLELLRVDEVRIRIRRIRINFIRRYLSSIIPTHLFMIIIILKTSVTKRKRKRKRKRLLVIIIFMVKRLKYLCFVTIKCLRVRNIFVILLKIYII
ncbi:hypothetical protein ACMBCN_02085, partial [Candidatus Liberibacter asiaticus]|nr:hypothetical protein [Candidatus Liberibacter asiaticus]